jgi:hypothetical protein
MSSEVTYHWRGRLTDADVVELVRSHGGRAVVGWWDQVREHSLGWVTARTQDGTPVCFVNVAWDGGDHAFPSRHEDTWEPPATRHRNDGRAPRRSEQGEEAVVKVVVGVDPHKRLNAVVVIDVKGKVLARRQFPNSAEGFGELRSFGRRWRPRTCAVEGCNGVG